MLKILKKIKKQLQNNYNTITAWISLGTLLTVLITVLIAQTYIFYRVKDNFNYFLTEQDKIFKGQGLGRDEELWTEQRIKRHTAMVNSFLDSVLLSEFIAFIISGIIGLVLATIISSKLLTPLKRLEENIKKMRKNKKLKPIKSFGPKEITELIKEFNSMQNNLKRIEMLREELVSDITHELKTPLAKLTMRLEGIKDGIIPLNEQNINNLLKDINQLNHLINQLQRYTQLRAGKYHLTLKMIDLDKFLKELVDSYKPIAPDIAFKIQLDKKTLKADPNKLREILDNLISNAIRYTPKGGLITIEVKNNELIISDTGKGIPAKDLPFIFERFYRVEKSRSKETGGLGLGLSIVKELVNLHGWTIDVTSKIGKGTKFKIRLGTIKINESPLI